MLKELSSLLSKLRETNSSNDKIRILKENVVVPSLLSMLIRYALDDKQFYVSSDNLAKHNELVGDWNKTPLDLLNALSKREITGHDAIKACNGLLKQLSQEEQEAFLCVLDKDLKCGVNAKLANKAVPNLIPTFSVALADTWKGEPLDGNWVLSRKLDGCFAYETPIRLANGKTLPIGEIVKNKLPVEVLSYNTKTKKVEAKKVVNWFDNGIKHKWVGVYFGDRKPIWATTNHKFYDGFEFTEIGMSDMATTLIDNSICPVPVERIFDDPFARAYDIEVEDNHNYFAGDFLVHNCRLVTFIDTADNITFYSRQGKEFLTLDVLKKELSDLVRAGKINTRIVLDGELCLMKDGVEDFQSVMKEVRRKDHTIENPMYILFDYLTDKEFFGDISVGYRDRLLKLAELPKSNYFKVVEHCDYSEDTFKAWQERVLKEGWEGLIARKNVPYESGRKKTMLKIKNFNDAEYVVEGVDTNGETTIVVNGLAKQVPAIRCLLIKHKGNTVGVGSGLTPEQRIDFLAHPEKIVGKTITVKFFSESQDENGNWSLRFPVVKYIYESKRDC